MEKKIVDLEKKVAKFDKLEKKVSEFEKLEKWEKC